MLHESLTRQIIGCAMTVHNRLGNGFQEVIYQRALAIELSVAGLEYAREHEIPVLYRGQQIGSRRVDFFVQGILTVELKALTQLQEIHIAQAMNYLEAFQLPVGLLINFGAPSLEFKRLHNKSYREP